jgi:hypothetical protein
MGNGTVTLNVTGMSNDGTWLVIPYDPWLNVSINNGSFTLSVPSQDFETSGGIAWVFRL